MSGDRSWAAALRAAGEHPEDAAAAWHAGGGQVVGLLGWSAPRELVAAAGFLPMRLSPDRLARQARGQERGGRPWPGRDGEPYGAVTRYGDGAPYGAGAPDGVPHLDPAGAFGRELAPATAGFAAALLSGALDWIDFLVIGRDREDYTRLFYLLRELRRGGAAPGLVPVAFFDLLRLPSRTSARYNRQRAAELTAVLAGWAGRPVTPSDLEGAAEAERDIAHSFGGIQALRTCPQPAISGTDALAAAIAARVLPAGELRLLLDAALAAGTPGISASEALTSQTARVTAAPNVTAILSDPPLARVFLAGSATDDLAVYAALEDLGIAIVGEDHEWGDDGSEYPRATRDPLDGIVDRYQFAHGGAARAGLGDRVRSTVDRIRAAGAGGVLYLLGPHDEAASWELPALREHLGGIPLVAARLRDPGEAGDAGHAELTRAGRQLLAALGAGCVAGEAAEAVHG